MKRRFLRAATPGFIIVLTILASGLVAGFTTLRSSREVVERYVSVWEEEVARNLLLKGDAGLFEKIRAQIADIAYDVESTGDDAKILHATGSCFAAQTLNVTLYGTPAGELLVCRSARRFLIRSLTSPTFAFGILAGLLLAFWLARRTSREASNRALNELAVRVAHDIRAPIMALKIAAAQDLNATQEVKTLVAAATNRISLIADELLNQSRPTHGHQPALPATPPTPKLLGPSIHELVNEKRVIVPPDVLFEIRGPHTPSGVPPAVSSSDFERVLANLLQNAIEATTSIRHPDKVPRIVIEACETSTDISVLIRDNGVGIPAEILPRLGETGFSFGKSTGNGIGFSSARQWARNRGGEIDIRSLVGTGTEVRLTIPRL
jgi:signal transduction histidine kinase